MPVDSKMNLAVARPTRVAATATARSGNEIIVTRRLIARFGRAPRPGQGVVPEAVSELTGREFEVLKLLARGLSNAEIAAELVLGENTTRHTRGPRPAQARIAAIACKRSSSLRDRTGRT